MSASGFHTKLFRLYEQYVAEPESKKDVYGYWIFIAAYILGALAVVIYVAAFIGEGFSDPGFQISRAVGVLGGLALTLGLFGLLLMLPVRKRAIQISFIGLILGLVGVVSFGAVYPAYWRGIGDGADYTVEVLTLYALGIGIIAGITALVPIVTGQRGMFVQDRLSTDEPDVLTGDALDGAQFAVFRDEEGDWAWHILHLEALGKQNETALTKPEAEEDIDRVKAKIGRAGLMELTTAAFRLFQTVDGTWEWTLVRDDGSVVAECGDGFGTRDMAEASVSFLKDKGPTADVIEIGDAAFNYYEERGKWHWQLLDEERTPMATGPNGYSSKPDAEAAAKKFTEIYDGARLLQTDHMAIELFERGHGWSWRFVGPNDQDVAESSRVLETRRDAEQAVEYLVSELEEAAITVASEPSLELYSRGPNWQWRLVDDSEHVVARNPDDVESYNDVQATAQQFAADAPSAEVYEVDGAIYEIYPFDGSWRWRLVTDDRTEVAVGPEQYPSIEAAREALDSMREDAAEAQLIEFEHAAFQVYEGESGEWSWRLIDEDGNVLADSGAEHESKGEAAQAMMTVKEQAPDAELLEVDKAAFELFVDENDNWGWRLIDSGGKLIAEAPELYKNRTEARNSMDQLIDQAASTVYELDEAAFQAFVDRGDWRWQFVVPAGDVVAVGEESYSTRNELTQSVEDVKEAADGAEQNELSDVTVQIHGNGVWKWRLLDLDRQEIATSEITYDNRGKVEAAVEELKSKAAEAPVFQIGKGIIRLTQDDGGVGWELIDENRSVIGTAGDPLPDKDGALDVIEDLRRLAPLAGRVDFDVASFELVSEPEGWSWRMIDANGQIIAQSVQTFDSTDGVRSILSDVRGIIPEASILEIDGVSFELHAGDDGWYWTLVDEHGQVMSKSTKTYQNRTDAREAMNNIKSYAPEGWVTFTG